MVKPGHHHQVATYHSNTCKYSWAYMHRTCWTRKTRCRLGNAPFFSPWLLQLLQQVARVERTMLEVSTLHQMFATQVMHQSQQIEEVYMQVCRARRVFFGSHNCLQPGGARNQQSAGGQ